MPLLSANLNIMEKACKKASKLLIRDFGEEENHASGGGYHHQIAAQFVGLQFGFDGHPDEERPARRAVDGVVRRGRGGQVFRVAAA